MITSKKESDQKTTEKPLDKEKEQVKQEKKPEENKDWSEYLVEVIKNPITTGLTGLAVGYITATFKANKEKEALIEDHKKQMLEQGQLFTTAIQQMQLQNKQMAQAMGILPPDSENKKTLKMEEDEDKVYQYKTKSKHIKF